MMRRTLLSVAVVSAVLTSFVLIPAASAETTRSPTSGWFGPADMTSIDEGDASYTGDGSFHVRGIVVDIEMHGDAYAEGTQHNVENLSGNWTVMVGGIQGTFDLKLDAFDGGFRGAYTGNPVAFDPLTGTVTSVTNEVGKGYGDLAGLQLRRTVTITAGPYGESGVLVGYVF
jgi:hypothetical protein